MNASNRAMALGMLLVRHHHARLVTLASAPLLALSLFAACGGSDADTTSTGAATSGAGGSSVTTTASGAGGATDATTTTTTSGGTGGNNPAPGYGAITGSCGDIDLDDVVSGDSQLLESVLDFTGEPMFATTELTDEGQAMASKGNLGGSSLNSELMAFELIHRCDQAKLLKGEAEIVYAVDGKKTDLLVEIDGEKVGVSVVRAMSYPEGAAFPLEQAKSLLQGKLEDVQKSSANVAAEDKWSKQILAVMAQTPEHAAAIVESYAAMDATTKGDTIVVVTVTEGVDQFIYYNQ